MNNGNKHIDFEELTGKYLSGEAQADEITQLEGWVKADPGNSKTFAGYKKLWIITGMQTKGSSMDIDREWQSLRTKLTPADKSLLPENEKGKFRTLRPLLRYAAIFVVVAAIAGVLFYMLSQPAMKEITALDSIITTTLPDGSEVSLKQGSKINYPSKFRGHSRSLILEGDAFFNITPDKEKPFVVNAGETAVTVLGTSFYLSAQHENASVVVIVSSGKVSLKSGLQEIILTTGDKGIFNKAEGNLYKETNTDENYISWKTKKMIFHDEKLEVVFRKIEETLETKIHVLNPEILQCRLTATFDNQSIETVMEILEATFGLEISVQNGVILVSGSACNK